MTRAKTGIAVESASGSASTSKTVRVSPRSVPATTHLGAFDERALIRSPRLQRASERLGLRGARGSALEKIVDRVPEERHSVVVQTLSIRVEAAVVADHSLAIDHERLGCVLGAQRTSQACSFVTKNGESVSVYLGLGRVVGERAVHFRVDRIEVDSSGVIAGVELVQAGIVGGLAGAMPRREDEHRERGPHVARRKGVHATVRRREDDGAEVLADRWRTAAHDVRDREGADEGGEREAQQTTPPRTSRALGPVAHDQDQTRVKVKPAVAV
jgi:hypothetical protein